MARSAAFGRAWVAQLILLACLLPLASCQDANITIPTVDPAIQRCLISIGRALSGNCSTATPIDCPAACTKTLSGLKINDTCYDLAFETKLDVQPADAYVFAATMAECGIPGVGGFDPEDPTNSCALQLYRLFLEENGTCTKTSLNTCPADCKAAVADLDVGPFCYNAFLSFFDDATAATMGQLVRACGVQSGLARDICVDAFYATITSEKDPCFSSSADGCDAACVKALSEIAWTADCYSYFVETEGLEDFLNACKVSKPASRR